jgi:zinc/manganese transport system permease protein
VIDLLALPFLACLILAGIHAYLGLHVLARGVIFVDLALAQVAALGMTTALLAGHAPASDATYYYGLVFTAAGAAVLALTRAAASRASSSHEAIIGIVYAVAASLTVLVLDRVPTGGEQIKQLLVGSILSVTGEDVARLAVLYAVIGGFHWLARRPFLAISLGAGARRVVLWDFLFYLTFGIVVTSSVRIAGVLLVFSYLIVPAVMGAWLAASVTRRLAIGWTVGIVVSLGGLIASYRLDLPTGATIVASFGVVLAAVVLSRGMAALVRALRRDGVRALTGAGIALGVLMIVAGAALAAFPGADHVWLDAIERAVPAAQDVFLTGYERGAAADARVMIERGEAELRRLRALQADVQWGVRDLPDEQRERLRQFLASRDEITAGDRLVLRTLRQHARARQRYVVGIPLALAGAGLVAVGVRARCGRAAF